MAFLFLTPLLIQLMQLTDKFAFPTTAESFQRFILRSIEFNAHFPNSSKVVGTATCSALQKLQNGGVSLLDSKVDVALAQLLGSLATLHPTPAPSPILNGLQP